MPNTEKSERFVSFAELENFGVRYCRLHVRRLVGKGEFPAPVRLSANRIGWRVSDLEKWMASRPTAYPADAA